MFFKIGVLKNFAYRKTLVSDYLFKKDTNTGLSCEICKIFKYPFFTERLWWLLYLVIDYFNTDHKISRISMIQTENIKRNSVLKHFSYSTPTCVYLLASGKFY